MTDLLGENSVSLSIGQMALRAAVVYIAAVIMVRLGASRAFSRNTALDVVMAIIFGATLSRAINGSAPLWPTLGAGALLVALHWLLSAVSVAFEPAGKLFKGKVLVLVHDGAVNQSALRKAEISEAELLADLRGQLHTDDLSCVREARLERGGRVSFVTRDDQPA